VLMSARRRTRFADESGFTLVIVLAIMAVVVLFTVGAFAAVNGDLPGSGQDVAGKQAVAAAEAGVSDYLYRLNSDSAYWTKCTGAGLGLNDPWTTSAPPATTNWRTVPGATTRYAIELLPVAPYTKCDTNPDNTQDSMIDPSTRSMRIRVTGEAKSSNGAKRRSVIATFKRTNFLDFLWVTDYEIPDPKWWVTATRGRLSVPSNTADGTFDTWGAKNCGRYYRPAPAGSASTGFDRGSTSLKWRGRIDYDGDGVLESSYPYQELVYDHYCTELDIQFAGFDKLLGPMHTNDEFLMCDGFTAGDDSDDRVESGRSWRPCDGKSTTKPKMQGTLVENAQTLKLPPSDSALGDIAQTGYKFQGRTIIRLGTDSFTVTNNGSTATKAYPKNGVIFVDNNGACGYSYSPFNPYGQATNPWNAPSTVPEACGNVWVSGTYNHDLTIASRNDVIIDGDVQRLDSSDARFGLIAENFVRVYHPVTRNATDPMDCDEPSTSSGARINGRRIDAAILSLQHSFMVDNYYCGSTSGIGTLTINGVIAQKYRGAVGTGAGYGFEKNYTYDRRLAFKGPPHFLDPVKSAWKVRTVTEQLPRR
jgi:hypothetical protein